MADQRSPASRHTGTGRFAPHQLQEADMETAQRSLTDQFQQVQRRAQQLMESMNIPGAGRGRRQTVVTSSAAAQLCRFQTTVLLPATSPLSHTLVLLPNPGCVTGSAKPVRSLQLRARPSVPAVQPCNLQTPSF